MNTITIVTDNGNTSVNAAEVTEIRAVSCSETRLVVGTNVYVSLLDAKTCLELVTAARAAQPQA